MRDVYKVVLLGEGRVGKTSLVSRFVENTFDPNTRSTTQAGMYTSARVPLLVENSDNNAMNSNSNSNDGGVTTTATPAGASLTAPAVSLHIWDTAGQERFHALGPIYYRNAHGAMLVYDITDADTLERVRMWIRELRAVVGGNIQLVICGNKADCEEERSITHERAEAFAQEHKALHFLTSAKTGMNVTEAFRALATVIAQSTSMMTSTGVSGGGGLEATTRRRRRGHLRIEDDEAIGERHQQQQPPPPPPPPGERVLDGKKVTGAGRANPSPSTAVGGVATASGEPKGREGMGVDTLSTEDYMYDERRQQNAMRSGVVDLRAPPPQGAGASGSGGHDGSKSSDSSRRHGCCA